MKEKKRKYTVLLPWMIADELERYINGETFRNKQHAFLVIIKEWLENQRNKGKGIQTSLLDIKPPARGKTKK